MKDLLSNISTSSHEADREDFFEMKICEDIKLFGKSACVEGVVIITCLKPGGDGSYNEAPYAGEYKYEAYLETFIGEDEVNINWTKIINENL